EVWGTRQISQASDVTMDTTIEEITRIDSKTARVSFDSAAAFLSTAQSSRTASRENPRQPLWVKSESEVSGMISSPPLSPLRLPPSLARIHDAWDGDFENRKTSHDPSRRLKKISTSRAEARPSCLVLRPNSALCLIWDVVCLLATMHDSVMIPLLSAFEIDPSGWPEIMAAVSGAVWLLDVFLAFFRGFLNIRTGFVEMRLPQIAFHYLTGWFVPDIALLSLDGLAMFMQDQQTLESLTLLRLFRNLRLLRLLKMTGRLSLLREVFASLDYGVEWASVQMETAVSVLKHLTLIALMCHFTGCAWYALGRYEDTRSWVEVHLADRLAEDLPTDAGYFYITSVHWALTQFTPAATEIGAVSGPERVFSVTVILAGLTLYSFFLGSINQSLSKLRSMTAQESRQNMLVRRYISEKKLSLDLAADILTCIRQRGLGKASSKIVFRDIKVLESLPHRILQQLQLEVGVPILESHAMMKHLLALSRDVGALCRKALVELSSFYGEELFSAGGSGDHMYFLRDGRLGYRVDWTEHLAPGARVGETCLWLKWEYRGQMTCADQHSHLFQLNAETFRKVMCRSHEAEVCATYARLFFKALTECEEASDLFGDDAQVAQIMRWVRSYQMSAVSLAQTLGPVALGNVFAAWRGLIKGKETRSLRR
ncbi:unnamed protein product, partial [Effrenium voratum]